MHLVGRAIPGAEDRQQLVPGFDQERYSRSHVICIGAGGLMSHIAPALVRKGIGALTILDDDEVEVSNLNRQRFYLKDVGHNKAVALARNLLNECIAATRFTALPLSMDEWLLPGGQIHCDVAVVGLDNDEGRVLASRRFQEAGVPVIVTGVSREADHGYVFVQQSTGPCFRCVFPDADNSGAPCPRTAAMIDILQVVGALASFAVDTILVGRHRAWNLRRVWLQDGQWDGFLRLDSTCHCD